MKYFLLLLLLYQGLQAKETVVVGSKPFTESYILAEIIAQTLEEVGEVEVQRKSGMGGTGILFQALLEGGVSIYPEYTGTISEAILKNSKLTSINKLNKALARQGLEITDSLGFNNTYALAMRKDANAEKISDLKNFQDITMGFSYEFLNRSDGLSALEKFYGFNFKKSKGMQHSLSYPALAKGSVDLIDVYTTDAKIEELELKVLEDDKAFFPEYFGVILARKDFTKQYPTSWKALKALENQITNEKMRELNSMVELQNKSFAEAAHSFVQSGESTFHSSVIHYKKLLRYTKEHLVLVTLSLLGSILVGVPFGIWAYRRERLAQVILSVSGLIQTIPSLALLCFFIPFLGIGTIPALCALFLYGLLPIVRNTYEGLSGISPQLQTSAATLSLSSRDLLTRIELPLASKSIMAGIKTSAVINVGTATLAAFIGAGGLGTPIMTGLALNDTQLILFGAIPSALLALGVHFFFELLDRIVIPKGLR